jgi:hypothetical protein
MAGYLLAVTFNHGNSGNAGVVMFGLGNNIAADQATAMTMAKAMVTAFETAKDGIAPTNVAALVSATR